MSNIEVEHGNKDSIGTNAENGDINAQYELALLYQKGGGLEKDLEKAIYWYQKAAENKCIEAQNNLAKLYYKGEEIEKNLEKAFYWCQKAAENGSNKAQIILHHYIIKVKEQKRI